MAKGKTAAAAAAAAPAAPAPAAAASKSSSSTYVAPKHTQHAEEGIRWFPALTAYLGYAVLFVFGHLRDYIARATGYSRYFNSNTRPPKGYSPLLQDWENFYTRRLYHRIQDCWNRPIAGPPTAAHLRVIKRESKDGNYTLEPVKEGGAYKTVDCLNLGSYNYLGFADDWAVTCKSDVMAAARANPYAMCTSFAEGGYTQLHANLERCMAEFLNKPAAIVFNMGYATNFLGIPALIGKGSLIISDSLNHSSIVNGARASGATIRVFKHNDPANLEASLRQAIVEGQERTHRPWKKIIVMVEGIYSMEGEVCRLPEIVAVCKRYKAYTYLDEAHSIGALGRTGRGVCEHTGVDTRDVDIMMGTFTKSFGAMGGYIAGSVEFIAALRAQTSGFLTDNAMSPVVCQQILTAFKVMKGEDGTNIGAEKLARLKDNANYFRERLIAMGLDVYGEADSPVIPMMLYNPTKIAAFSRYCLDEGLAVVVVGFPATPVLTSRTRFCISAGHTREQLDEALIKIERITNKLQLHYRRSFYGG